MLMSRRSFRNVLKGRALSLVRRYFLLLQLLTCLIGIESSEWSVRVS